MPPSEALPEDLRGLNEFQGIPIDNANWLAATRQIIAAIDSEISAPGGRPSQERQPRSAE
jgi:hypothetical protein